MNLLTKEWKAGHDIGLLILRIVAASVLIYGHGSVKWGIILSGQEIQFMDPIGIGTTLSFYLAAFAEGVCTLFLIAGLFTRIAACILTINFLVIFSIHYHGGFSEVELLFFYLFSFITLLFTGAGNISLDHILFNKNK